MLAATEPAPDQRAWLNGHHKKIFAVGLAQHPNQARPTNGLDRGKRDLTLLVKAHWWNASSSRDVQKKQNAKHDSAGCEWKAEQQGLPPVPTWYQGEYEEHGGDDLQQEEVVTCADKRVEIPSQPIWTGSIRYGLQPYTCADEDRPASDTPGAGNGS